MSKLGTDKNHQKTCSNDKENPKVPKKTEFPEDSKEYKTDNIKNLFLYCLGKSPNPLTMSEIQDAIGWELEGSSDKNNRKEKPKFRRNYVYKIEKKLFYESEFIPSVLIFTSDDILKYEMEEYMIHISERSKEKLAKFFRLLFHIENEVYDLSFEMINDCKKEKHEIVKAIRISDHKSNYLRIEINTLNLQCNSQKKSLNKKPKGLQKNDLKMFIGSPSFVSEKELNVYKKLEKGRLAVRDYDIFPKIYLKNYIDNLSPNNSKKQYVLNLRGLLKYLSNYKNNKSNSYKRINKMIENLARVDKYWSIEYELFGYHNIPSPEGEEKTNFILKRELTHQHNVKRGFPFLSFYNQYKDLLPKNYAAQILIDIAVNLQKKLETLEMTELKYQVTELFFEKIRDYFWESFGLTESRIEDSKSIPESVYNILKECQNEIHYYLSQIKEMKSKIFIRQGEYYKEYNSEIELKQKILKYLDENQKPVIWIKDVLYPGDLDSTPVRLSGSQIGIIEEICESSGLDYVTNKRSFLFKQTEIEKIKGCLKSYMPLEMAKKLVFKHGISNETAIRDVILLCGFKTTRIGTGPRVIIKRSD